MNRKIKDRSISRTGGGHTNGPYNLFLPTVCCPNCSYKWTPGIKDLLECRYWPATTSCQILFSYFQRAGRRGTQRTALLCYTE
ncbi:unnamed protein product [Arctogadus glacialis]